MEDLEQVTQVLVGLITRLNAGGLDEASNTQLSEFTRNPNVVYPCFSIIESSANATVVKTAYIILCNSFHFFKEESEQRTEVFSRAISLIPAAPYEDSRNQIIDKICDILTSCNSSPEIVQFLQQIAEVSFQLIENEETLKSAFRIWANIIAVEEIRNANIGFIYETLIPLGIGAFSAAGVETRTSAYKFIMEAFGQLANESVANAMPKEIQGQIIEQIIGAVTVVAETSQDISEATELSICVCKNIWNPDFAYGLIPIIEPIIGYVGNTELDSSIRIQLLNIATSLIDVCGVDFAEQLQEYIPVVINFVVELATVNPEEGVYRVTDDFFKVTAEAIEGVELEIEGVPVNTLSIYYPLLHELIGSQEPPGYLASFLIFSSILRASAYAIIELYDEIEGMISTSLESSNELLMDSALRFLCDIVYEERTMAPHVQAKFETVLQSLVAENPISDVTNLALEVLVNTYSASETAPANPLDTIQFFLSQFELEDSHRHELAFQGISETVSYMDEIPDTLYSVVSPYIKELIGSGEGAICSALETIGTFAIISHNDIVEDLEGYIEAISQALASKDDNIVKSSAIAAMTLFECFQSTLESQVGTFFELALNSARRSISEEEDGEIEDPEEEGEIQEIKREAYGNALILACILFSYAPEALKEGAEELQAILFNLFLDDTPTSIAMAAKAAPELITGLMAIDADPAPIFIELLHEYSSNDEENTLQVIWAGVSSCIRSMTVEKTAELSQEVIEILCNILDGKESVYTKGGKEGGFIKDDLIPPLLETIEALLVKLEGAFEQFIPELAPRIVKIFDERSSISRSRAFTTVSMIISFFPGQEELIPIALKELETDYEATFQAVRQSIFMGIHYLTLANKELIQEKAEELLQVSITALREEDTSLNYVLNAAILWGTLVQAFEVEPSAEDLELVLNCIPAPAHSYLLRANAIFIDYCLKKWQEATLPYALTTAVTVLGSDDYLVAVIPAEVAVTLASVITSAEEGQPEACASNFNERQISNFRRHIEELSQ